MCGGASPQQRDLAVKQSQFADVLNKAFETRFAGQTDILKKLNSAYTSTIAAGQGQHGFDAVTRAALEGRALDTTAANYQNAARAVNNQLAGRGGDSGILSGVDAQIKGAIATESAKDLSDQQRQIAIQDAMLGNQNYQTAIAGMNALSGQYDPQNFATLAGSAQNSAFNSQKAIDAQRGGFWKTLGGIASTGLGVAKNFFPGGAAASTFSNPMKLDLPQDFSRTLGSSFSENSII